MKIHYSNIQKLKIPIYKESKIEYVLGEDLREVLSEQQMIKFNEYFGIQTCLLTKDGKTGLYLHDTEDVLERIFNGKKIGTQLYWD